MTAPRTVSTASSRALAVSTTRRSTWLECAAAAASSRVLYSTLATAGSQAAGGGGWGEARRGGAGRRRGETAAPPRGAAGRSTGAQQTGEEEQGAAAGRLGSRRTVAGAPAGGVHVVVLAALHGRLGVGIDPVQVGALGRPILGQLLALQLQPVDAVPQVVELRHGAHRVLHPRLHRRLEQELVALGALCVWEGRGRRRRC